jgi:hypothetical protein
MDFWQTRVLRSLDEYSASATPTASQQQVYQGAETSLIDHPPDRAVVYYTAFARDRAGNWSTAARTSIGPQTSLSVAAVVVAPYGKPGVPWVRLLDSNGLGIPGRSLALVRADGLRTTMSQVDGADGTYSASAPLVNGRPTSFSVSFAGDTYLNASSAGFVVKSKAYIYRPKLPSRVTHRKRFTLTARLKPTHRSGTRSVEFRFDRLQKGKWVRLKVARAVVTTKRGVSRVSARLSLRYAGRWRVCAAHADYSHAEKVSAKTSFRVR